MSTSTISLDDILREDILPALPASAISLMKVSQSPDAGPADFARPIEADPGLMGQVLKFTNSSFFGFSREIISVPQAITLVGSRAITNFALWNAVFSVIPNPKFGPFDLKALWQDSLRRAVFARRMGRMMKIADAEDLFAGALLQDMAIPLLLKELPEEYEQLMNRRLGEGVRLSCLEREVFGWDHAEAAGRLSECWSLPPRFGQLIVRHTELESLLADASVDPGVACVAIAAVLPSSNDDQWDELDQFIGGFEQMTAGKEVDLEELLRVTDEETSEFAPLLKLSAPKATLISMLQAQQQA